MPSILPALEDAQLDRLIHSLQVLSANQPQSILFEGGSEAQRLQLGQYWAMLANCPTALSQQQAGKQPKPCLSCSICRKISAFEYSDLFVYDGRISNTDDEENPGLVRSLRMENIRDLKVILGSPPNGDGKRLVIIQGMLGTREEAMNSLLKILEEPSKSTLFVLLTSQRDQILPTLLSRSICLTLPWRDCLSSLSPDMELLKELALFFQNGTGFLDKIGRKGLLDNGSAGELLLECQKALARIMAGKALDMPLDKSLSPLINIPSSLSLAFTWLNEAHMLLKATVSPARVMEALACRIFGLLHS